MDALFQYLITRYAWLIDSYMINYFTSDLWSALPSSWQSAFEDAEPQDCIYLVSSSGCPSKIIPPLSILCIKTIVSRLPSRDVVSSPSEIAKACAINWKEPRDFLGITARNSLRTKMKLKKQHEIDRVVAVVSLLKESDNGPFFNTVIDIGAGMGHLVRVLSMTLPGCTVFAMEQNSELVRRSAKLDERLNGCCDGFVVPRHCCESVNAAFHGSVFDGLAPEQKALLIGLHPCGDLSGSILRIFVESPAASAVILVGCCYHKLSVHQEVGDLCDKNSASGSGFPLSSKYRSIELSYAARDLACHGNERFAEQLLEKPRDKFRIQCFRAAVEWVVANHGDDGIRRQRSALVPSSVTTAEGMTFEEYVRHALARHPEIAEAVIEQVRCDERVRRFVDQVENEWRRFLVVHCLRLLFAPLVEHLLIMDRVEFLKDHGHQGLRRKVLLHPPYSSNFEPKDAHLLLSSDHVLEKKSS